MQSRFHTTSVKTGKSRSEQMFSGLPPKADVSEARRHVREVPISLQKSAIIRGGS